MIGAKKPAALFTRALTGDAGLNLTRLSADPSNGQVFEALSDLEPISIEKHKLAEGWGREERGIANWIFLSLKELG